MIRRALVLLAVLAGCGGCEKESAPQAVAPAPMTDKFNGTYSGDGLTLTIKSDGKAYHGTATLNGQTFDAHAGVSETSLHGVFISNGKQFSWSATGDGETLTFKTGGTEYILKRNATAEEPDNPLARKTPAQTSSTKPSPTTNVAVPAPAAAPAPKTSQLSADAPRFTKLSVKDPGISNIEAISFLIPQGWKPEGGVQWFPDYSILANLLMKITDPRTGGMIEFLPVQNFTHITNPVVPMQEGQNYMGNIVAAPIEDPRGFVEKFYMPQALKHLQGAQIITTEDLRKVAEQVAIGYGGQSKVTSTRIRYAFQHQGKPWEEDIFVTLVYTPWQLGTLWSVYSAYSFRAPKGELDRLSPLMRVTISSIRLSPEWFSGYMYVQKLFNDRMNQGIKNAAAISATITRNSNEIREMFSQQYKDTCASQDRVSQSFSEYVRGVDTYKNPYEDRPIQLPAGYQDAWVNRSGEYILSPQSSFDPNVGSTTEWRRMEHAK